MDKRTVSSAHERIDDMQVQVAEIRTEVKIQFREVFTRVKRLEAIMIGASASIIAMLVHGVQPTEHHCPQTQRD